MILSFIILIRILTILLLLVSSVIIYGQEPVAQLAIQTGHSSAITQLAFSNDGSLLASVDRNGIIKVWFVSTGNEMASFISQRTVDALEFSDNADLLYLASDSVVTAINLETNQYEEEQTYSSNVKKIIQHQGGQVIIADDVTGADVSSQYPFVSGTKTMFNSLLFLDKERWITEVGGSGRKYQLPIPKKAIDGSISFSRDGTLATFGYLLKLTALDLNTNKTLFAINGNYTDESFISSGISTAYDIMVGGNSDGIVYVASLSRKKIIKRLKGHLTDVTAVLFSPDESIFATASEDRSIILWDSRTLEMITKLSTRSFKINTVQVANDQPVIYFGDEFGMVKSLNLNDLSFQINYNQVSRYEISDLELLSTGSILVASHDNKIRKIPTDLSEPILQQSFRPNPVKLSRIKEGIMGAMGYYIDPYTEVDVIQADPDEKYLYVVGDQPRKLSMSARYSSGQYMKYTRMSELEIFDMEDKWSKVTEVEEADLSSMNTSFSEWYRYLTEAEIRRLDGIFVDVAGTPVNIRNMKIVDGKMYMYTDNREILGIPGDEKLLVGLEISRDNPFNKVFDIDEGKGMFAMGDGNELYLHNYETQENYRLAGHNDKITSLQFLDDKPLIITSSHDATLKLWNTETRELVVTIIPIDFDKVVIVTPDNYYLAPKGALDGLGFRQGSDFFPVEQFDLIYNRPDIVLSRIGFANEETITMFEKAYAKRLRKMNFAEIDLSNPDLHLPESILQNSDLPLQTSDKSITLDVQALDSKYTLNRLNVSVNNIPLYGMKGFDLSSFGDQYSGEVNVNLSPGKNTIKVSVINDRGVESLATTFDINCQASFEEPTLYTYTIGVSEYQQSDYNLEYASKDARDVANLMMGSKSVEEKNVLEITDVEAGREKILEIKQHLMESKVNDKVLVFVAGHGVLDENLDYYLATHDMDFANPSLKGLPYEELENILDGIPARNKLLMIDACHSGEVDKEEVELVAETQVSQGEIKFRAVPGKKVKKVGLDNSFELMKTLFADLRKNSGAIVISSAGGAEYAIEGNQWKNGVFTYSLINGIKSKKADLNKDGVIRASELQKFLEAEVTRLTEGKQKPTSRVENQLNDFVIWQN